MTARHRRGEISEAPEGRRTARQRIADRVEDAVLGTSERTRQDLDEAVEQIRNEAEESQ